MATSTPQVQILVDWANNPVGTSAIAGNNFTDISQYVRLDTPLNITRGRQDNISTVQAGRCVFTVDNSSGRFTPGNTGSPYYPGVLIGRRVQVNVKDELGVYHTRFDGQIAEYNVDPKITGFETLVQITCSDVIAYLNRLPQFSCWTVQESNIWAKPALQYVMNEPTGSQGIHDSSGNNGPTLAPYLYTNGPIYQGNAPYLINPTITYGSGNNPAEGAVEPTSSTGGINPNTSPVSSPLSSVGFGATMSGAPGGTPCGSSAQFQGRLPFSLTVGTNAFTVLGWLWPNPALTNSASGAINYNMQALCLSNTRTGAMLSLLGNTGGSATWGYYVAWYTNYLKYGGAGTSLGLTIPLTAFNGPVMVAMVINGTTASMYLGGNIYGSGEVLYGPANVTVPSGTAFNFLSIGGPIGGGDGWLGNISNVCVYQSALSSTYLTDIAIYGAHGPLGAGTGQAISRITTNPGYSNLPPYWCGTTDNGLSIADYVDITGANATTVLQNLSSVEKGLYYANAAGQICFGDRSRRMSAPAPAVTLPSGSYNVDIKPKWNDQGMFNYESLQNVRGGMGVVAQNPTSIGQYGFYANGSPQSPQTAPYYTWNGGYFQRQVAAPGTVQLVNVYNNQNIQDSASWDVNTLGQPAMKLASLTIDILKNTPGHNEYVAPSVLYGLEINQPVVLSQNLAWWPNSADVSELFIEGVSETYSTVDAFVTFYTSPAYQARAWQPGSAAYGQLDVSARVGISNLGSLQVENPNSLPAPPTYSATMNYARTPWTFACSGTPTNKTYFIATNAQAAQITPGDKLTDTLNAGTTFTVISVGPPSSGFNNITVTPTAAVVMGSTDTVTQVVNGFVGATDQRGISSNLQAIQSPVLLYVQQTVNATSLPNATNTYIVWDASVIDTVQAMNQYTNGATSCLITLQGWYEIYLTVNWANTTSAGDRRIWIVQNQTSNLRQLAPAETRGTGGAPTGLTTSAVIYCNVGDAIAARAWQNSGAALSTSLTKGGSHMSLRYLGNGTARN